MSITIEEIKTLIEKIFTHPDSPVHHEYNVLTYRFGEIVGINYSDSDEPRLEIGWARPLNESLLLQEMFSSLPAILHMVKDLHAENERLKADNERVALRLKYPSVKLGLRVRYQGEIYRVVGGDYTGKAHLKSEYGERMYCQWSDCEVIE